MKKLIFLLCITTVFTSCSSYYYSQLSASKGNVKNEQGCFVTENDSVRIVYSFHGENAPVNVSVFNKTGQPLYIDWQRSALIVNGLAVSYQGEKMKVQGNINASTYDYIYLSGSETYAKFNGVANLPKTMSFIPPHSNVVHTPLRLENLVFDSIPNNRYQEIKFAGQESESTYIKILSFSESDSPLCLRSYLVLYMENGNERKPLVFEQNFYLSELIKAGNLKPKNFNDYNAGRGDFFYVEKVKGSTAGAIVAAVAVTTAAVAIESQIE